MNNDWEDWWYWSSRRWEEARDLFFSCMETSGLKITLSIFDELGVDVSVSKRLRGFGAKKTLIEKEDL